MDTFKCYTSWRRFFTSVWWKLQLLSLITGKKPLNIVATFEVKNTNVGTKTNHFDDKWFPTYPIETSNIHACAHNAVNAWKRNDASGIDNKMRELELAVIDMGKIVDAHFSDKNNSNGVG